MDFPVVKIPWEFQLYAVELDQILLNNIEHPLIKELFEKTKVIEGKKIDRVVDFEVHIPFPSQLPLLATYEYEFLLCLEYLFLDDRTWMECKFSIDFFNLADNSQLPKVRLPLIETNYKRFVNFLKTCYIEKSGYKAETR